VSSSCGCCAVVTQLLYERPKRAVARFSNGYRGSSEKAEFEQNEMLPVKDLLPQTGADRFNGARHALFGADQAPKRGGAHPDRVVCCSDKR
jgi:hypothetical protein